MKKRTNLLCMAFIIVLMMSTGCTLTGMSTEKESLTLGYCPTMSSRAEGIAAANSNVVLQPFGSTAHALQALDSDMVDVVLVGRLAGKNEVGEAHEKRLESGLTLVGHEKTFIPVTALDERTIHTAADNETVDRYLPTIDNVVFYESKESAIEKGLDDLVLIHWSDYTHEFGLVIPVDSSQKKVEKFRIPVLYSYDEAHINYLEV